MDWKQLKNLEPGKWSSPDQQKTAKGLNKRIGALKAGQANLVDASHTAEAKPLNVVIDRDDPRKARAVLLMEEVAIRRDIVPWMDLDGREYAEWKVAKEKEWAALKDSLTASLGALGWKVGDSWANTDTIVVRAAVQQHPQVMALAGLWNVVPRDNVRAVRNELEAIEEIEAELQDLRKARVI